MPFMVVTVISWLYLIKEVSKFKMIKGQICILMKKNVVILK